MEAAFWIIAPLFAVLALYLFGRHSQRRRTKRDWERMPTGAGYNPLQEFVEPASRHVVQAESHAKRDEDEGESGNVPLESSPE